MTITNARQYRVSRAELTRFERAIEAAEHDCRPRSSHDATADEVLLAQAREQAAELRQEIEEFERVIGSGTISIDVHAPADLPSALIHARLAAGLTQKELAHRLGVSPQQVQRDER